MATTAKEAALAAEDDAVIFKYVYIPADTSEQIEERTFETTKSDEVMSFINALKRHFKRAEGHKSDAQKQAVHEAFKAQMGDKAAGVNDDLLKMLSGTQMVEPIALLANSPETGFVGVYMYCDDQASIKQLPPNPRATAIAQTAGMHIQVNGDVFLGRYMDNEEDFERMDFTTADLSSAAAWVADAKRQIARRSERSGDSQVLLQRLQQQQQPAAGSSGSSSKAALSPADAAKARGNEAFAKGDWQAALEQFTASLKLDSANIAARNNRALTYLKLEMFSEAAADCSSVLAADSSNVKALLRRAAAHEGLGQQQEALADLLQALQLQPQNAEAKARLAVLEPAVAAAGPAEAASS
ncbi:hypothetical protein OEZ85_006714 [Tetradesmus obliquus]|uniref:Uncharacterized protein n=1 Tax=Tetradesmus obliquus TaxID=3088 RepID=A0ABY8TXZ4_TETOB|nr:hypothetical protein OEZ85_006714 [Tetradesmus obliquus]